MSDEPKFFYDEIDMKYEKEISFWAGIALGAGSSLLTLIGMTTLILFTYPQLTDRIGLWFLNFGM